MADSIIKLSNVNIFQREKLILSDVSFSIAVGEFIYLIGKVGSGKTSLIKTLYSELPLKYGEGEIAGYKLNQLKIKEVPYLRRKLGIIFQDFQLLSDRSVYQNLIFVLKATGWKKKTEMDERIDDVLNRVDLADKKESMPHQLSGGEQQRVVIARAILNNPEIILADEPTGNLDPETSDSIMKLLIDISRNGTTIIMATHNYSIIKKYPCRTIKCEYGKIVQINSVDISTSDIEPVPYYVDEDLDV
jgi:cell division transport system ATP-binding protein